MSGMLIQRKQHAVSIGLKENPPGASGGFFVTGLAPLSDDERQDNQCQQHARCVHGLTSFLGREEVRPRGGGGDTCIMWAGDDTDGDPTTIAVSHDGVG
jgi:hypothetical protein